MHDTRIGAHRHAFRQYLRHIFIGGAGMDDQRQPSFLRRFDVHPQANLLNLGAFGGVVVIQPGFANADEFRVL
ncbi:MAG: hypothetical protein ACD_54C00345G0002 [uncultured bacterium]|nr:MAG: hypothetical protein ACD_54C00345G0002 [uncultured bacterium]